uniref:GB1/RHD3-type G domain-containing protein n=1 Tax=Leptobrachium leishanense TaxID=445787 RepID=A0A8C5RA82_9ANUR
MEQLHYVTELTKRIRLRVSGQKEDETVQYKRIFPSFTWCVRDFTLELKHNGKDITEDEYLMISLKRKQEDPNSQDPDHMKEIEDYNLPRRCILQYFHSHKCFVFGFPVIPKKLKDLENLADHDLEGEFVAQSKRFCNYIFRSGSIKTLPGALVVNGRMLGSLAVSYVEAIKSGAVPCIENAVVALAESENTQAVKDAVTKYEAEMNRHVGTFPTETEKEFVQLHLECEKTALEVFMARSFQDNEQTHQRAFKDKIKSVMKRFSQRNEDKSSQFCMKLLDKLNQTLQTNIAENYYSKPGGHKLFLEEKKKIMETYKTRPGRGVKAHSAEQEFLTNLKEIETTIRSADVSMSEKDKELEAKKAKNKVLRREKEMAEETNKKLEERLELEKKRVEHHKEMLEKKMEEEKEKMKKENEEFLERNLKDQEAEQEFLANFTNNENQTTIRRADVSMSEKEKEIGAEKAEAEAARREKEIAEETNKKLEESLEQERKPSEQHMEMLIKMIKEEREKMVIENKAFLERKLKMILAECLAQGNKRFEQYKVELEQKMQEEREKMRKEYEAILKRKLKEADDLQEAKFKKLTSKLSDHSSFSESAYL